MKYVKEGIKNNYGDCFKYFIGEKKEAPPNDLNVTVKSIEIIFILWFSLIGIAIIVVMLELLKLVL